MKKIYLFIAVFLFVNTITFSQVKDLSLTFSPVANYTWWSNQSGLEDDFLYGGNVGFGFGEFIELRATHLRNDGIKRDFTGFGLPLGFENIITANREFDLTRWGGEFKANIGSGNFNPYVVLGSGVQTIDTDFDTSVDNIYASLGLGFKIGFSDRIALVLEGRNTVMNANTGLSLLTDTERSNLGLADSFFESERLYNWSALASLQFYLGGRAPGKLSELDKSYKNKLKQGFKGFTFLFEPAATYIDFDNDTFIRDTWLLGGYLGFDFNKYLGIRGFYFQSTQDEKLFNDFDDLAMYGAELRANLNDGKGVVPYLTLGGGYINIYESTYQGVDNVSVSSSEFAKGGLGLEIPVSKYFSINASASSFLTSGQNFEDLGSNDELRTNWAYSIGIHLKLGKKDVQEDPEENEKNELEQKDDVDEKQAKESKIKSDQPKDSLVDKRYLEQKLNVKSRELEETYGQLNYQQKREDQAKIDKLKRYYEREIGSLNKEYQNAIDDGRLSDAVDILEKRKDIQIELNKLERLEKLNNSGNLSKINKKSSIDSDNYRSDGYSSDNYRNRKSTDEDVSKGDEESKKQQSKKEQVKDSASVSNEKQNDQSKKKVQQTDTDDKADKSIEADERNQAVIDKLDELLNQLEDNESDIKKLSRKVNNIDRSSGKDRVVTDKETIIKTKEVEKEAEKEAVKEKDTVFKESFKREYFNSFEYIDEEAKKQFYIADYLEYKGLSAFTGFNIGQQGTFNIGSRMHYGIENTSIEVMPEVSLSISSPFSFGVAVNAVHPFKAELPYNISPYAGIGTGYLYNDDISHLTGNLLIGFYTDLFGGRIYVDYTNRNLFKFNQLAVGYRFNF